MLPLKFPFTWPWGDQEIPSRCCDAVPLADNCHQSHFKCRLDSFLGRTAWIFVLLFVSPTCFSCQRFLRTFFPLHTGFLMLNCCKTRFTGWSGLKTISWISLVNPWDRIFERSQSGCSSSRTPAKTLALHYPKHFERENLEILWWDILNPPKYYRNSGEENHRIVGVGWDLQRSSGLIPQPKQVP